MGQPARYVTVFGSLSPLLKRRQALVKLAALMNTASPAGMYNAPRPFTIRGFRLRALQTHAGQQTPIANSGILARSLALATSDRFLRHSSPGALTRATHDAATALTSAAALVKPPEKLYKNSRLSSSGLMKAGPGALSRLPPPGTDPAMCQ